MYSDVVRSKVLSQTRNPSALVLRFRVCCCCCCCCCCFKRVEKKLEIYNFGDFFAIELLRACPQIEFSSEKKIICVPPPPLTNVDF